LPAVRGATGFCMMRRLSFTNGYVMTAMSAMTDKYYIELYADLNINIETFALTKEQKEELKKFIESYWHLNQKEELVQAAKDKVFEMRIREIMEDD
jgi:proteasome assembly chaperone (PAC2) family protein